MNNTRFRKPETNKKTTNKGFYIALGICLVAVGAAAWMTYNNVMNFMEPENTEISSQLNQAEQSKDEEKEAANTLSGIKEETSEPIESTTTITETNATEQPDSLIVYPVSSNIIKGYSNDNPVFSKTLSDWRVHNATDFSAEQGSTVKAMSGGEVTDVYDDPSLGMTVVISHDSGYTSYYSGLGDTVLVEKGQKISSGDDIGSINDVPSETSDGFHLHLVVKQGDNLIDPMSILKDAKS